MQEFSQAADNNKDAILAVLAEWLPHQTKLLEIGSGSGPTLRNSLTATLNHVLWQPIDLANVLPRLRSNIADYGTPAIAAPITLDLAPKHGQLKPIIVFTPPTLCTSSVQSWGKIWFVARQRC